MTEIVCYYIMPDDSPRYGAAVPVEDRGTSREFRRPFMGQVGIETWHEQRLIHRNAEYSDFIHEARGPNLFSDRFKAVLDRLRNPDLDVVEWLPAVVQHDDGESRRYWYAFFPTWPDVLHQELTVFTSRGEPVKPVLDCDKIRARTLFPAPNPYALDLIISGAARDAVLKQGCVGVVMKPYKCVSSASS